MDTHSFRETVASVVLLLTVSLVMTTHAFERANNALPAQSRVDRSSQTGLMTEHAVATQKSSSTEPAERTQGPDCDGQPPPSGALTKWLNRVRGQIPTDQSRLCVTPESDTTDAPRE